MEEPLLDIKTLVERPAIAIDGRRFEILSPEELSVLQYQRFGLMSKRIGALQEVAEPAEADIVELETTVAALTDAIMVGVPPEVQRKLSHAQRLAVAEVFTVLSLRRRIAGAAATIRRALMEETEAPSTGASTSPGSNGSTAAPPAGGSPTPPSPSSGPTSP